jgi:hypothetical protein
MNYNYKIPVNEALDRIVKDDPVPVMFQPYVGVHNYQINMPRDKLLEIISLRRDPQSAGICRSGVVGQGSDFGVFLPMMGWGEAQTIGMLFIRTLPSKRVPISEILAYEAQAARGQVQQQTGLDEEEIKRLN